MSVEGVVKKVGFILPLLLILLCPVSGEPPDEEAPTVTDNTPGLHQRGTVLNFMITLEDNVEIEQAYLEYRYSSNDTGENVTLDPDRIPLYSMFIPYGSLDDLHYRVTAIDTSKNRFTSEERTVELTDRLEGDDFPDDPAASLDSDGDGYPDEWNPGMGPGDSTTGLYIDAFPSDPAASLDSDGDGYPDRWNPGMDRSDSTTDLKLDEFVYNSNEWSDRDNDGIGDQTDFLPSLPNQMMIIIAFSIFISLIVVSGATLAVSTDKQRLTEDIMKLDERLKEMEKRGMNTKPEREFLNVLIEENKLDVEMEIHQEVT